MIWSTVRISASGASVTWLVEQRPTEAPLAADLDAGYLALVGQSDQGPFGELEVFGCFLRGQVGFHRPLPSRPIADSNG